jgi:membrane protein DedA with SNARE-associated domain
LGLLGVILGDCLSFGIGWFAKGWVQQRFGKLATWQQAQETFQRRGGLAIYLTRFLLTPLALPTNLIAGGSHYAFRRFFFYDIVGELTWLVLFGGLGYAVGSEWEVVSEFISNFSGFLVGLVILIAGIHVLFRRH